MRPTFCILIFTALLAACKDIPPRNYPLRLLVSQPIGKKASDHLPDYILQMAMPYGKCGEIFLVPKPSLERLDVENSAVNLETEIKPGMGGNKNNIKLIEKQTRNNLEAIMIGAAYIEATPDGLDLQNRYETILTAKSPNSVVLVFSENFEMTEFLGQKVYHELDSLRFAIAQSVCEGGMASVAVLLNPVEKRDIPTFTNDETIRQLHDENVKAGQTTGEAELKKQLEAIDTKLAKQAETSGDWRLVYERVLNRIYGKEHHEAFDFLREAAELAIKKGESRYLYDRIEGDKNDALWKLSHGHPQSWNPIIEALEHGNAGLLEKSESGHNGHESH